MMDDVSRFDKFVKLKKSILSESDFITSGGKKYIMRSGWVKIASYFNISFEVKESERKEFNYNGVLKVIWRYRVRASTPDGIFSEVEGIASSDEPFFEGKSEYFLSSLAETRALNKAISLITGAGEVSAEELEGAGFLTGIREERGERKLGIDVPKEDIVEEWEHKERKLESEMEFYSSALTSAEPTKIKLESINRKELLMQISKFMTDIGLKTAEEKRNYVAKIIGKNIPRAADMSDEEILRVYKHLKSELEKRKIS